MKRNSDRPNLRGKSTIRYKLVKQKLKRDFLDEKLYHNEFNHARGKIKLYDIKDKKVRAVSEKQAWFLYYNNSISPDFFTVGIVQL